MQLHQNTLLILVHFLFGMTWGKLHLFFIDMFFTYDVPSEKKFSEFNYYFFLLNYNFILP